MALRRALVRSQLGQVSAAHVTREMLKNEAIISFYKNCIGAIDGTHIKARLPKGQEVPYIGRKCIPTQNIMAIRDFNMCFTFVWLDGRVVLMTLVYSHKHL